MGEHTHRHRPLGQELHHLEQVAEAGESNETPVIVAAAAFAVLLVAFLVILGLSLLAYRLA